MRTPRLIGWPTATASTGAAQAAAEAERAALVAGLLAQPAQVSPKYFYNALGAHLFGAITELDEYYPTRTEAAIFSRHGAAIAAAVHAVLPSGHALVDLGAGDGAKAEALFPLLAPGRYVAVDIGLAYLGTALARMQQRHPQLELVGVGLDFSTELTLPPGLVQGPSLVFYPGSSIGNFGPGESLRLLRQARAVAAGGALLIGVDLAKPRAVLEAAYDDALGVTAAFNLNLLRHVNRVLGSDFEPRDWQHVALFDEPHARIEMHLQARRDLCVRWPGAERRFAAGERLLTEYSYKWTVEGFAAVLRDAGYARVQRWSDERDWFAVMLAWG